MSDEELIDALAKAIATSIFDGRLPSPANVVDYRTEAVAALAVIAPELESLRAENARLREALKPFAEYEFDDMDEDEDETASPFILMKHLRAARAAMEKVMKKFDENSYCPKCHSDKISSLYVSTGAYAWHRPFGDDEKREHINRRCVRCNYMWNEAPLDARAAIGDSDD